MLRRRMDRGRTRLRFWACSDGLMTLMARVLFAYAICTEYDCFTKYTLMSAYRGATLEKPVQREV